MYGERSDNESQTDEEIKQQVEAEAEKEKEKRIVEEKTDTVGEVWDVVFSQVFSIWNFRDNCARLAKEIIRQASDAEVSIKVYEWDFARNKVYAKVEISRAIYASVVPVIQDIEIHAIDEISFSTAGARQRKKT